MKNEEMVEFNEKENEIKLYYCENLKKLKKPSDPYIHPYCIKIKDLYYYNEYGEIKYKLKKLREIRRIERLSRKKYSRKNNRKYLKYLNRLKGKRKYVFNQEPVDKKIDYYIEDKSKIYKIRKLLEWF